MSRSGRTAPVEHGLRHEENYTFDRKLQVKKNRKGMIKGFDFDWDHDFSQDWSGHYKHGKNQVHIK